jgi:hypothetical protein
VPHRPLRPRLAAVALLALCDYLLWNWSLSANHDILALVSGMTLIPLLIALAWLVVLTVTRLLGHVAQRSRALSTAGSRTTGSRTRGGRTGRSDGSAALRDPAGSAAGAGGGSDAGAVAGEARTGSSSSKLAA